jgi:hypothetical protein
MLLKEASDGGDFQADLDDDLTRTAGTILYIITYIETIQTVLEDIYPPLCMTSSPLQRPVSFIFHHTHRYRFPQHLQTPRTWI